MAKKATGQYRWRIVILPRALAPQGANAEEAESWPDPPPSGNEYQAARESFTAGETIVQGIRQSTGAMKFRVKGVRIPVTAADRVKVKTTDEMFAVTGVARDEDAYETVLTVERVHQQGTGQ